jgi:hypothetical protein
VEKERRRLVRRGKKQALLSNNSEEEEEDKEKEMELEESEAHPKSPTIWAPALKKAHTAASTQVQLPNPNLPLPEQAAFFAKLSFNEIGMLPLIFTTLTIHLCDPTQVRLVG